MGDSADFQFASVEPPESLAFDQRFDIVVRRLADAGGDHPSMGARPARGYREGFGNRQRTNEMHRLAVGGSLEQRRRERASEDLIRRSKVADQIDDGVLFHA